jgi:hypothetical protein
MLCYALCASCFHTRPVCFVIMRSWKIYLFKVPCGVWYGEFAGEGILSLCKWGAAYPGLAWLFGPPSRHSSKWTESTYQDTFRHSHCILRPFSSTLTTRKLTASSDTLQNVCPVHVHSRKCCHLSGKFVLCYRLLYTVYVAIFFICFNTVSLLCQV